MGVRSEDARVQRLIEGFEQLAREDVARLADWYTRDAFFKDPFNEVRGSAAVQRIFEHMFVALEQPRFVIRQAIVQGDQCFLTWDFLFRMKRFRADEQTVRGASHIVFAADGRVAVHRDYWDAAEELYEKLPVVGALMRWLKARVNS